LTGVLPGVNARLGAVVNAERQPPPQGRRNFFAQERAAGTEPCGARSDTRCDQAAKLVAKWVSTMSPILPISFLLTLLCALGAVEGVLFQQLMFVGAALSATILVCSVEAWSAREIPVRTDDERKPRNPSD
jgi:hypothetical protein